MSWLFGWLPGIPSINLSLPSSIQGRFVSFVLKKLLGKFVKPGQLDIHHIDSQVGSGFVQVNDLQLECGAINILLSDIPIELHHGSIASAVARIPWPNPLTSSVGFSLRSLHLVFHLLSAPSNVQHMPVPDLSSSVASIAESFVHDELTPREERFLRESIHPDLPTPESPVNYFGEYTANVPGSIDPFLTAEDEEFQPETDPEGVSIFASLIERLLARFEFDAVDTRITLVHHQRVRFTATISEIRYDTESNAVSGDGNATEQSSGVTRRITVAGVTISAQNLQMPTRSPSSSISTLPAFAGLDASQYNSPPNHSPQSVSRSSSSSSLDEETHLQMSQSIVNLPPRSVSPASSLASSLYQSAISTAPTCEISSIEGKYRDETPSSRPRQAEEFNSSDYRDQPLSHSSHSESTDAEECQTILSIAGIPIVVRLTTPSPTSTSVLQADPSGLGETSAGVPPLIQDKRIADVGGGEKSRLSLEIGTIACAFRAWQIQRIIELSNAWAPPKTDATPEPVAMQEPAMVDHTSPLTRSNGGLDARLGVRHIVVMLLPSNRPNFIYQSSHLTDQFFEQPLSPPSLKHGYVRGLLEGLSLSLSVGISNSDDGRRSNVAKNQRGDNVGLTKTVIDSTFSISEVSVLYFHASTQTSDPAMLASPVVITNRHLPSQYPAPHIHPELAMAKSEEHRSHPYPFLPAFGVIDWTMEKHQRSGQKLSTWRYKSGHSKHQPAPQVTQDLSMSLGSDHPSTARSIKHGDLSKRVHQMSSSALLVNAQKIIIVSTAKMSPVNVSGNAEVTTLPLHIFVDLEMLSRSNGVLAFLEEIFDSCAIEDSNGKGFAAFETDHHELGKPTNEAEDGPTSPATSGPSDEKTLARERLRLERFVLKDMDIDEDYSSGDGSGVTETPGRKKRSSESSLRIKLPMIRIEIRTPSASTSVRRSGALALDLHDIVLSTGSQWTRKPSARFARTDMALSSSSIFSAECRRIVLACSPAGVEKATAVLSVGPYMPASGASSHAHDGPTLHPLSSADPHLLKPRIFVNKSRRRTNRISEILVLVVDMPSAHISLSKAVLDDLQYWADDVSQFFERLNGKTSIDRQKVDSRDTSLIGSRYFAMSKRSDSDGASTISGRRGSSSPEAVVKISVSEAYIRLMIPRDDNQGSTVVRPIDVFGSDVDVLIELNPDEKDETVLTVGVMDLNVVDISMTGAITPFLSSSPRSSISTSKSIVKLRLSSLIVPETTSKESRIKLTLTGFTYNVIPDFTWIAHVAKFFKAPPHVFESVIPNERTRISLKILDGSVRVFAPANPGALLFHLGEVDLTTDIAGDSEENFFRLHALSACILFSDEPVVITIPVGSTATSHARDSINYWKGSGYALLSEISDLVMIYRANTTVVPATTDISVDRISIRFHLCADTLATVVTFLDDLKSLLKKPADEQLPVAQRQPATVVEASPHRHEIMFSIDEYAFKQVPEVGLAPDMIHDDLPTNLDYLDESFGTAAGLRELRDDDLDDFNDQDTEQSTSTSTPQAGIISKIGGETIKLLRQEGVQVIENYFLNLPPDPSGRNEFGETTSSVRIHNCDVVLLLYDGYDWGKTRKVIETEVKEMRRRLAKIRQLVATGQNQDPSIEETSTLLFNSVYIGLQQNVDELEPGALIAAIDEELNDDFDTTSQSSWQSLRPVQADKPRQRSFRVHGKRLTRSMVPCMEFRFSGLNAEIDQYRPSETLLARTLVTIKDVEILDHIKTSTWQRFLTELRVDSRGNIRETDSNMVRIELRSVRPVPGHPSEEARLRAKILPLRLYVDQDALDFLKFFFSFQDPQASPPKTESSGDDVYFQFAEIFPVDLKLDYKPRRVDYRALKEGRTIELMNFFHFDGAEMTLRHITISGITGWAKLFELLNDLWTPDVKATQLMDVISGVSPIRSVVNVGSGIADLVLLPIAQYKKDGRIVRGIQKGTTAFMKSTATEALKMGARLATGTQVILEQAEGVLGSQFRNPVTAEAMQVPIPIPDASAVERYEDVEITEKISRYAQQPMDIREGVQTAYRSLQRNFSSAAQTILAVPMEVYERSGNEGPVRAVIRAVPIAVLKPMIGATEAVSKTLLGIRNTLDPDIRHEAEVKYKQR